MFFAWIRGLGKRRTCFRRDTCVSLGRTCVFPEKHVRVFFACFPAFCIIFVNGSYILKYQGKHVYIYHDIRGDPERGEAGLL